MGLLGIPDAVLTRADRVADEIAGRTTRLGGRRVRLDAGELLTGRAALLGLAPAGRVAAGGATQLLAATDGWWALTLSRPDDVVAVPALLESPDAGSDPWAALRRVSAERAASDLVARARLLGMPAALLGECAPAVPTVTSAGVSTDPTGATVAGVLVADLSSMWAGPLCGRLLAAAGATVVKVETDRRPDGTRSGHRGFFDWINGEKLCYSADFDSAELAELLTAADVVIEGSRPAGLIRRGLGPHQLPARPGRVWLRITGYGAEHPDRVAFGDDAAVAGGLVRMRRGRPMFCGDAIADPLTGLGATRAVLESLARGGGQLIEVSIASVSAMYAATHIAADAALSATGHDCVPPRAPALPREPAGELGADNAAVRRLVADRRVPC